MTITAFSAAAAPTTQANSAYLAANAKKKGVVQVPGLQYPRDQVRQGHAAQPPRLRDGQLQGLVIDGKVFDQSKPASPSPSASAR